MVADVSDEWTTFAGAVEDELRSWDTYLERLQATAATKDGNARERAEAAIADVRTRRIAVYDRLAQARRDVNGAWHVQRNHVSAARDELEQKADELSAKINVRRGGEQRADDRPDPGDRARRDVRRGADGARGRCETAARLAAAADAAREKAAAS